MTMMKKRNILYWAMGVVMTQLLGSCAFDELHGIAGEDNVLSFGVEVNAGAPEVKPMGGATRSGDRADSSATGNAVMSPDVEGFFPTSSVELSSVDGKTLYANCDERSGINMHNNVDYKITRGTIRNNDNFYDSFALYGYVYNSNQTWPNDGSVDDDINGIEMSKNGTGYNASGVYWPGASNKATFFAVAPKDCSGASITANSGGPKITYTVPQAVSSQEDLLVAVEKDVTCDGKHAPNPLTFNHALAAIKFEVGEVPEGFSISNVEISGVYNKGELSSFDNLEWTNQSIDGTVENTYTISGSELSNVLFLMPQTFPDGAEIKVTFSDGSNPHEFSAKLKDDNNTSWKAGHQYTYKLSVNKVTTTYKFEVTPSTAIVPTDGGDVTFTVTSVLVNSTNKTSTPIPWQATYSLNGTPMTASGDGGESDASFTIHVPSSGDRTHKEELQTRKAKGTLDAPFDLSKEYNEKVNTANCYVITAPGVYKLPLVYGNAVKNGFNNKKAYQSKTFVDHNGKHITQPYIYLTSYGPAQAKLLWQDAPNLVTNCSLINEDNKNKYLQFEVSKENIDQGNAVIAVQDVDGTTLWSWHIWVTDHPYRSTIAVKNNTGHTSYFMPVPLGWCDTGSTGASKEYTVKFSQKPSGGSSLVKTIGQVASLNTAGNAPFYQWGRKDPFVGSTGGSDNKTKTWYDGSGNTITTNPVTTTMRSREESIKNPEKFILVSGGKFNWDANTTYDNWNANVTGQPTTTTDAYNDNVVEKTVYDPSPVGFKMPTTNAFTGFVSGNTVNCEGTWDHGYKFKTGLASPNPTSIYFRANGRRNYNTFNSGSLAEVTAIGSYWTSGTPSTNDPSQNGCYLFFRQDNVSPQNTTPRANGLCVRPVSE